jgi:hypothetical protein
LEKEKERKKKGKREKEERREGKTGWGTRDRRSMRQGRGGV